MDKQNPFTKSPMHSSTAKVIGEKKKLPELLKGSEDKFKLVLTETLVRKINYLCEEIPNNEWSGIVFYRTAGTITDIKNLIITAFDVYPLDIGTATYTEFDYTPDLAGYMATNLDLLDANMGLMHSHNNMATFFSGTDTATLREQAPLYKTFLSIIVNNRLSVDAALSVATEMTTTKRSSLVFQDFGYKETIVDETKDTLVTKTVAMRFDAEIHKEYDRWQDDNFSKIVGALKKDTHRHSKTPKTSKGPWGGTPPAIPLTIPFDNEYLPMPTRIEIDPDDDGDIFGTGMDYDYDVLIKDYLCNIISLSTIPYDSTEELIKTLELSFDSISYMSNALYQKELRKEFNRLEKETIKVVGSPDDFEELLMNVEFEFNTRLMHLPESSHLDTFALEFTRYLDLKVPQL